MIKNIVSGAVIACFAFFLALGVVVAQTATPATTTNTTTNTTNDTLNTTTNTTTDQPAGAPRTGFGR